MTQRITMADLDQMLTRARNAAQAAGIDVAGWRFHHGSKMNGISYKLDLTSGSLGVGWGANHLGSTAREAYDALQYLAIGFEMAAAALRKRLDSERLTERLISEDFAADEEGAESLVYFVRLWAGVDEASAGE